MKLAQLLAEKMKKENISDILTTVEEYLQVGDTDLLVAAKDVEVLIEIIALIRQLLSEQHKDWQEVN